MAVAGTHRYQRGFVISILAIFLCFNFLTATSVLAKKTGKRQFFSVGTAPPGGAFFVVGGAIAQVVRENVGRFELGGRRGSHERHARKHSASFRGRVGVCPCECRHLLFCNSR